MARPSRIHDRDLTTRILENIQAGVPPETACRAAGVGASTYYRWMQRGEAPDGPTEDQPYREFREAVRTREAQAEASAVVNLRRLAAGGIVVQRTTTTRPNGDVVTVERFAQPSERAIEFYLERRHRSAWRQTTGVEVSGPDGGPVQIEGPEDLQAAIRELDALIDRAGGPGAPGA